MGPPNPPNLDSRKGRLHYDKLASDQGDPDNLQQMQYLSNYQIQNLAHQGMTPALVQQTPRSVQQAFSPANTNLMLVDNPAPGQFMMTSRPQPLYGGPPYRTDPSIPASRQNFNPTTTPSIEGPTSGYSSFSNFSDIKYANSDSLPVISGDMMLPGPISSTGDSNFSGATTLVEGCSTISNLSIMSQPGSVEHIPRSLSPVQNMGTNTSSQDNLDSSTPMIGKPNTDR